MMANASMGVLKGTLGIKMSLVGVKNSTPSQSYAPVMAFSPSLGNSCIFHSVSPHLKVESDHDSILVAKN